MPRGEPSACGGVVAAVLLAVLATATTFARAQADDRADAPPESELAVVGVEAALHRARDELQSGENVEALPFADGSDWVRTTSGFAELLVEITNLIYLQSSFIYLRTVDPQSREDGTLPARNDYVFTVGITVELG